METQVSIHSDLPMKISESQTGLSFDIMYKDGSSLAGNVQMRFSPHILITKSKKDRHHILSVFFEAKFTI
jgi:hypothetical protein